MALRLSKKQSVAFTTPLLAETVKDAAQRLHKIYPSYFAALSVEAHELEPVCQAVTQWASRHNILGRRDISQLCCVACTLGHRFWRDPRFRTYVDSSVGDVRVKRPRAVQMMISNTAAWLAGLWSGDTLGGFAARLEDQVRRNAEPTAQTLTSILPNHWVLFSAQQNNWLLSQIVPALPPVKVSAQRLAYTACALVHGAEWVHDPQYARLARSIHAANTPSDLADSLSAIYGRIS